MRNNEIHSKKRLNICTNQISLNFKNQHEHKKNRVDEFL